MKKKQRDTNRMAIDLPNGRLLVVEQCSNPLFDKEVYITLESKDGMWYQDIAVVRNAFRMDGNQRVIWSEDKVEVLVYSDGNDDDYTNKFSIGIHDLERSDNSVQKKTQC